MTVPPSPTTGLLRWLRGSVVGAAATVLAWGAHLSAGGTAPGTGVLLAVAAVSASGGVLLSGRRWRLPGLLAMAVAGQVALHVLLSGAVPLGPLLGSGPPGMAGMAGTVGMAGMPGTPDASPAGAWLVPATHLLAALLTSLLLVHGESWVWRLAGLLRCALVQVVVLPVVGAPALPRPVPLRCDRPRASVLVDGLARRGPPARRPSTVQPRPVPL